MALTYTISLYNRNHVCLYSMQLTLTHSTQLTVKLTEILATKAIARHMAGVARMEVKTAELALPPPTVSELEMLDLPVTRAKIFAFGITKSEWPVLLQRLKGRKRWQAAADCHIEHLTAKKHIENIYSKLNVHTLQEARIALLKIIAVVCTFLENFELLCIS